MAWQAESVMFVLMSPEAHPQPYELFQKLVGLAPEALAPLPPPVGVGSVATGPFDRYQLNVIGRPGRFEINLVIPPSDANPKGLIEEPVDALRQLVNLAKTSLPLHPIHRLSFVAHMATITDTSEDAKRLFFERTSIHAVDCVPTDLLFQYNSPKEAADGIPRVNRLARWLISSSTVGAIVIPGLPAPADPPKGFEYHALNLILDVNVLQSEAAVEVPAAEQILEALAREAETLISELYARDN